MVLHRGGVRLRSASVGEGPLGLTAGSMTPLQVYLVAWCCGAAVLASAGTGTTPRPCARARSWSAAPSTRHVCDELIVHRDSTNDTRDSVPHLSRVGVVRDDRPSSSWQVRWTGVVQSETRPGGCLVGSRILPRQRAQDAGRTPETVREGDPRQSALGVWIEAGAGPRVWRAYCPLLLTAHSKLAAAATRPPVASS